MKRKIEFLFFAFIALSVDSFSQDSYKKIGLYKNEIHLRVPKQWKTIEGAMRFSVYEIKYDVAIKNPKDHSGIDFYVFDSLYGPKTQITDSIVEVRKKEMFSDPNRKVSLEEGGIRIIAGINVGYLKYTFQMNKKGTRIYAINLFFCNKRNIYYRIEIIGLNRPIQEFKIVAEKVFNSLEID